MRPGRAGLCDNRRMQGTSEREGVIKFVFEQVEKGPVGASGLTRLAGWRQVLRRLALLGRDPQRYEGVAFGNVSQRRAAGAPGFFISGSQTGGLEQLGPEHWVEVLDCEPERNFLRCRGSAAPSAESMTHAAVYAQSPRIRCVLHGHSPELWRAAARLGLPETAAEVPYGTPAMAREVGRLFAETAVARQGIFVMAGHEDGVIALGGSPDQAGRRLVTALARALAD